MYNFVNNLSRSWKRLILLGVDLVLAWVSLVLAFCLHLNDLWPVDALSDNVALFLLVLVIAGALSIALGIPSIKLKAYETRAALKTGLFAGLVALTTSVLNAMTGQGMSPALFIIFGVIFFSLSVTSRVAGLRLLLWIYSKGETRTRVLIYGAGSTGVQLVAAIGQSNEIQPVGLVDDNKTLQNMMVAGLQVYSPARIPELVHSMGIDRVVLAMPSLSLPRQSQIARRLEKIGCDVHRLPSFSELVGNRELVNTLEPVRPAEFLGRNQLDESLPGVSGSYAGKNVLVSGAGGSIGSELCRQLLACKPARLVLFEQSEPALYSVNQEIEALTEDTDVDVVAIMGSACNRSLVEQVVAAQDIQIILHAAAHKHVPLVEANEVEGLRNNILGTRVMAEVARDASLERFVLISSDKAVRPTNVMGASKRLAELVVQDLASRSNATLFSMVRFGNVLGSSGSVVPLFQEQIARGGPVTLTDENVTRFFMTLSEAARLVLLAGSFASGGDVFVLDMGDPMPIRKLAHQMIERAGYTIRSTDNPEGDIEIVVTGLRPGEKLHEELLIGAGLETTPHPKILRASEEMLSEIEIANMLRDLNQVVETGSTKAARNLITRWVEGYHIPEKEGAV